MLDWNEDNQSVVELVNFQLACICILCVIQLVVVTSLEVSTYRGKVTVHCIRFILIFHSGYRLLCWLPWSRCNWPNHVKSGCSSLFSGYSQITHTFAYTVDQDSFITLTEKAIKNSWELRHRFAHQLASIHNVIAVDVCHCHTTFLWLLHCLVFELFFHFLW